MKRPAFQFYPADWRNNAKLRRCSWAARGAWIEVMGLMHDSDEYGVLRWPLKEIAQALGCPIALIKELAAKEVLKGCDAGDCPELVYIPRSGRKDGDPVTLIPEQQGPIWYSSRMVKDDYVRNHAGASTRFSSDNPKQDNTPSDSPSQRQGERQGDTPSQRRSDGSTSSSSSSVKPKIKTSCPELFAQDVDVSTVEDFQPLENQNLPTPRVSTVKYSDEDFELASWMWEKIRALYPEDRPPKPPKLESWADEIRKIRQHDKRRIEDIRDLFAWANADSFWCTNIRSPEKLRSQWDQLVIQRANRPRAGHMNGKQAARDSYAAQAAQARERENERPIERDITGESERVA